MKKFCIRILIFLIVAISLEINIIKKNKVYAAPTMTATVKVYQESDLSETGRCYGPRYTYKKDAIVEISNIIIDGVVINSISDLTAQGGFHFIVRLSGRVFNQCNINLSEINNGVLSCRVDIGSEWLSGGFKEGEVKKKTITVNGYWRLNVSAGAKIFSASKTIHVTENVDESNCYTEEKATYELCDQISEEMTEIKERCINCFVSGGVWTAVGCIVQTPEGIITTIVEISLVIAGTVVLIMILVGAFMLSTSQGDPKKTEEAKELITSAIIGLLFIVFSITILQFIGVSILRIPGFGQQ